MKRKFDYLLNLTNCDIQSNFHKIHWLTCCQTDVAKHFSIKLHDKFDNSYKVMLFFWGFGKCRLIIIDWTDEFFYFLTEDWLPYERINCDCHLLLRTAMNFCTCISHIPFPDSWMLCNHAVNWLWYIFYECIFCF